MKLRKASRASALDVADANIDAMLWAVSGPSQIRR